jgi:hypothetical protein
MTAARRFVAVAVVATSAVVAVVLVIVLLASAASSTRQRLTFAAWLVLWPVVVVSHSASPSLSVIARVVSVLV